MPAIVLLSILRREMEDILIRLSDLGESTQVFNHLLLPPHQSALARSRIYNFSADAPMNDQASPCAHSFAFCLPLTPLFSACGSGSRLLAAGFPDRLQPAVGSRHPFRRAQCPHLAFFDLKALQAPGALAHTELLVLPYGSAVPADAWKAIEAYLQHGGNLLVLGGQPLHVPVTQEDDVSFRAVHRIPMRGTGFASHLRSARAAGRSFRLEAGLRLCHDSEGAGREVLHRGGSSQRTWLYGRRHRIAGSSPRHRDRPSTGAAWPAAASSVSTFSPLPGTGRVRTAWPSFASLPPTRARVRPAFRLRRFSLSSGPRSDRRSRCICTSRPPQRARYVWSSYPRIRSCRSYAAD